jgi:hypothetical protein
MHNQKKAKYNTPKGKLAAVRSLEATPHIKSKSNSNSMVMLC